MNKIIFLLFVISYVTFSASSYAQNVDISERNTKIYERPTMKKLSQLFWALDRMDYENEEHIDNFLRINECQLYKEYKDNEFKWHEIRKSAIEYIEKNKKKFPTRFEFIQPISLGEYNLDTKRFELSNTYKINNKRYFTVSASDGRDNFCGKFGKTFPDYLPGIFITLSRPITLKYIPIDELSAKELIKLKLKEYKAKYKNTNFKSQKDKDLARQAYAVMKVRFFGSDGKIHDQGAQRPKLATGDGILESIEIYADLQRMNLLYQENFIRKRQKSNFEVNLEKEYEEFIKRMTLENSE